MHYNIPGVLKCNNFEMVAAIEEILPWGLCKMPRGFVYCDSGF